MPTEFALIGAPCDGAATRGWPGARYAPDELRRHLGWMKQRAEDGKIYWLDRDAVVAFDPDWLLDAGDAAVVPHEPAATLEAVRVITREQASQGGGQSHGRYAVPNLDPGRQPHLPVRGGGVPGLAPFSRGTTAPRAPGHRKGPPRRRRC